MNYIASYWDTFLTEGIEGLTFSSLTQRAEKVFYISYGLASSLLSRIDLTLVSPFKNEDSRLNEGMDFLKHSFGFFVDKYKEEYAFHPPIIFICLESLQLKLNLSMRLKEAIHE